MPKEEAPTLKEQAPSSLAMKQEIAKKLVLLAKDVYKSKRYIRSGKANTLILQAQFSCLITHQSRFEVIFQKKN